jgi:hypothetical protein
MRTLVIARTVAIVLFLWTLICLVLLSPSDNQDNLKLTPLKFRGEHSASYPRSLTGSYCFDWERPGILTMWADRHAAYSV